ncbi:MAG: nucleotide exchange factor GrpE [Verrucomicrobia subdivision 3 bacterium]|nr:nucleotide exchange factor GrpE [Limisphaerales bacterium]
MSKGPKSKDAKSSKSSTPKALPLPVTVPKWPFLLADIIFIGLAYWISTLIDGPAQQWHISSILVCAGLGAAFAVAPFYFEYRAEAKAVEIAQLTTVAKEVNNMETVAAQISEATASWNAVQESSGQTAQLAEEIAAGIAATVKEHHEFMAKAGNDEHATLKLEVEKLRRAEQDWASTLVGQLDLIFRLERSAAASGKEPFMQTMATFQGQCRELAKRVGLVAFEADADAAFDAEHHAVLDNEPKPTDGDKVTETRLPGIRLQGRLIRKPLVSVA